MNVVINEVRSRMLKPAVDKRVLIMLSGITWSIVGIFLCVLALYWLSEADASSIVPYGLAGTIAALLIYYFGFSRLVDKNTKRILSKNGKVCIFAFQAWKNYLLVAVMVGMGFALRRSPLPRQYLAIIYLGFGGAMILSSLRYYGICLKDPGKPPST